MTNKLHNRALFSLPDDQIPKSWIGVRISPASRVFIAQ